MSLLPERTPAPRLGLCLGCKRFVRHATCPFCGADARAMHEKRRAGLEAARQAVELLRELGEDVSGLPGGD